MESKGAGALLPLPPAHECFANACGQLESGEGAPSAFAACARGERVASKAARSVHNPRDSAQAIIKVLHPRDLAQASVPQVPQAGQDELGKRAGAPLLCRARPSDCEWRLRPQSVWWREVY
jgi:hypothetical protein